MAELQRLVEWNFLNELEGQQVAQFLEGLKHIVWKKKGVQMAAMVDDAQSSTLKVELMMQ